MDSYTEIACERGEITPREALELLETFGVPHHMIEHSKRVAGVACFLARELGKTGYILESSLVEAGALLHDVAKAHSLRTGERHTSLGEEWLRKRGHYKVAAIVRHHVRLPDEEIKISEVAVVNYADKRVKETRVVSLKERFEDIIQRYGVDDSSIARIHWTYERAKKLEHILFAPLPFDPDELVVRMEDDC